MIIRDLTLRSAQSFGSFHLIRLLFDEYLLYLVELRLAKASNKPVIYVMTQVLNRKDFHSFLIIYMVILVVHMQCLFIRIVNHLSLNNNRREL